MEIVSIIPSINIADTLRRIAEDIDDGDISADNCTLIIGTEVYHLGPVCDDVAARDAVFNMTMGIHKLMTPIFDD
ncbi:MAG: hypothetical protein V3V84_07725 [Candidatus Bathyarchaeia archaeon]